MTQIHWIQLSPFGEQFYRENWQRYLYPDVDAPEPEEQEVTTSAEGSRETYDAYKNAQRAIVKIRFA